MAKNASEDGGYANCKVTVKSDQKDSIVAFKRALALAAEAVTYPAETLALASKANGNIERTIQSWQANAMVLRNYFERRKLK